MRTLAISNYKGGVGKTTTAVNLATIYAGQGRRVLLIDLDPQASATDFFGLYECAEQEKRTSVELLYGNATVADVAYGTDVDGLSVVPSVIDLIDQNELLLCEQRLKFALDDAAGDFDICIIDCSPVMKRLAFNAYLATSGDGMIVIPVKLDGSVMRGTALTVNATRAIADALRMPMPKYRILRTCVPGRQTRSEAIGADVLDGFFPDEQFRTVIHASTKVCEGSWQMVSGHRRKAAYELLAKRDERFARMPCRVVESIDDAQALVLLHTANYFVRELSITERAAATRALGIEVERKRRENPDLSGRRTEDIKADILAEQTGRHVSGKTIKREEALANKIEAELSDEWKVAANSGEISAKAVSALAALPRDEQTRIAERTHLEGLTKRQRTDAIQAAIVVGPQPDRRLAQARRSLAGYAASIDGNVSQADLETIGEIARIARALMERTASDKNGPSGGL